MRKKILTSMLILLFGIIGGAVLLVVVFSLPTNSMHTNIKKSLAVFEEEGTYPHIFKGYVSSRLDNFTEAIMITNVISNENDSVIANALKVNRVSYNGQNPLGSLISYANGEEGYSTYSYARYWHGYLIFLKPLFMLFDYPSIRIINFFSQYSLLFILIMLLVEKGYKKLLPPIFFLLVFLYPITVSKSLQFSSVYYILILSLIGIFYKKDKIPQIAWIYFLVIGMLTSFLDLLTYPLVTLGIPLILYFVLFIHKDIKTTLIKWIELCFFWGLGYAGMWFGKWVLATVLVNENVLLDAFQAISTRAARETSSETISTIAVLTKNINMLVENKIYLIALAGYMLWLIGRCVFITHNKIKAIMVLPIGVSAILPFIWYFVLGNHSYIHFWFTYRILTISVFSILCLFVTCTNSAETPNIKTLK